MKRKILLGICGIGQGHSLRQKVILEILLSRDCDVVIFAFKESLRFYRKNFKNLKIIPVAIPWIHGSGFGIDFLKTSAEKINNNPNFIKINFQAMDEVIKYFGRHPDFVISDYEPISAQLAYIFNIPLFTIDQQSKYLTYDFYNIDSMSAFEEKQRLSLFFPKAEKRFACSFFQMRDLENNEFKINIVPSFIRNKIIELQKERPYVDLSEDDILVYFSPYGKFIQPLEEVLEIFASFHRRNFYIFSSNFDSISKKNRKIKNVYLRNYDSNFFGRILRRTKRVICTAGHNFLSEIIFLEMASYVVPLQTFEQHYNAHIVGHNNFGVKSENISTETLDYFFKNTDYFIDEIRRDNNVLFKTTGRQEAKHIIQGLLSEY